MVLVQRVYITFEIWAWFTKQWQETHPARVGHNMWSWWLNTKLFEPLGVWSLSSAGQNILDFSRQTENKLLHSGSDKQLHWANCGFPTSMWAELLLAGPSTNKLKLMCSTRVDNHPDPCLWRAWAKPLTIAFSILNELSVCLPISRLIEQVLPKGLPKDRRCLIKYGIHSYPVLIHMPVHSKMSNLSYGQRKKFFF